MMVTSEQKHVIDCVLAIFETGKIPTTAAYSTCTVLSDGAGISYGKHQATDKSGSLDLVSKRYVKLNGIHAEALSGYLPQLSSNESTKINPKEIYPEWLNQLIELLKTAGADPLMQQAQDEIFDELYWLPAVKIATEIGLQTALGQLTIYDTCIHSGAGNVSKIRKLFPEAAPVNGGDEKTWVLAYIAARKNWLQTRENPIVHKTVYRMDELKKIADADNWNLKTPLIVRKVKIV